MMHGQQNVKKSHWCRHLLYRTLATILVLSLLLTALITFRIRPVRGMFYLHRFKIQIIHTLGF